MKLRRVGRVDVARAPACEPSHSRPNTLLAFGDEQPPISESCINYPRVTYIVLRG